MKSANELFEKVNTDLKSRLLNEDAVAIRKQIDSARAKYKPEMIKLLFVAEAPPETTERFFYYETVKDNDWLYIAIVKAISMCDDYDVKKIRANKKKILELLQQDGIFLMDLSPVPLKWGVKAELHKEDFMQRLNNEKSINKQITDIILIKANVYDCLFLELKENGYRVQNQRIPFPASGQQQKFAEKMKKTLKEINYCPDKGVNEIKKLIY